MVYFKDCNWTLSQKRLNKLKYGLYHYAYSFVIKIALYFTAVQKTVQLGNNNKRKEAIKMRKGGDFLCASAKEVINDFCE